jgi:hypothetical protein
MSGVSEKVLYARKVVARIAAKITQMTNILKHQKEDD